MWVQSRLAASPRLLRFFDLTELELYGGRPSENRDRDAQATFLVVHVFHRALEVGERAVLHAHHLAHFEQHLGLGLLHALAHLLHDRRDLLLGNRGGFRRRAADEAGHLVRVLHEVPGVVVHFHLDEHVAGEELALRHVLLATLHFDDLFDRHENLAELVVHAGAVDAVLERALHRFLEARVGMDHVPALISALGHFFQPMMRSYRIHSSALSVSHRNSAITTTNAKTAAVVCIVSLRVGQTTFFTSATDSPANTANCLPGSLHRATAPAASRPAITARMRTTSGKSASQ